MAPDFYREIDIRPDASELLDDHVPFLRKNIVFGKYDDVDHYLDVQFRLLRENIIEFFRIKTESKMAKVDKKTIVYQSVRNRRQGAAYTCELDGGPSKNIDWKVSVSRFLCKHVWILSDRYSHLEWLQIERRSACVPLDNFKTINSATIGAKRRGESQLKFEHGSS